MAGAQGKSVFVFLWKVHTVSQEDCSKLHSHPQCRRATEEGHSYSHFVGEERQARQVKWPQELRLGKGRASLPQSAGCWVLGARSTTSVLKASSAV